MVTACAMQNPQRKRTREVRVIAVAVRWTTGAVISARGAPSMGTAARVRTAASLTAEA
jgi:hypothetical protein